MKTYPSLSIFSTYSTPWIPDCPWNWDFGFRSLLGFRIPWAVFWIPKPRIPDSTSKNSPNSLTWSYTNWIFSWVSASIGMDRFSFCVLFSQYRARDIHKRICLLLFHIIVICSGIGRHVKKKVPWRKSHGLKWKNNWSMRSVCSIMVFGMRMRKALPGAHFRP